MPIQLSIGVYNSAGERVRFLFDGRIEFIPQAAQLSGSAVIPGLGSVGLLTGSAFYSGEGSLGWDGSNDGGQAVSSGAYTYKVEFRLPDDRIVAYSLPVQAVAVPLEQSIEIFNSAGERVYKAQLPAGLASGGFRLEQDTLITGSDASGAPQGQLKLVLQTPSGDQDWSWDGRNDQGAWVHSGTYTLQMAQAWPDGRRQTLLKSFTVLRAPDLDVPGGTLSLGPSPLGPGQQLRLAYSPAPGQRLELRLYNLAGEAVATVGSQADSGRLGVPTLGWASGVYVGQVRFMDGAQVTRVQRVKVAVVK
jgi:hypothetical protein